MDHHRIVLLLSAIILAVFGLLSCTTTDTSDYWPVLFVDQPEYDFGRVKQGEIIRHTFHLTNKGKGHLRLINVRSNTTSLEAYPLKENLGPGETTEIRVVFDTDTRWGSQRRKITIDSNDPNRLEYPLSLTGTILADYELEPHILYAKRRKNSKVHFGSIALRNVSGKAMKLVRLDSGDERVKPSFTPPFRAPVILADGQTVSIDAEFRPDLPRKQGKDVVQVYVEGRERPITIAVRIKRSR